jgi:hypothetical protein
MTDGWGPDQFAPQHDIFVISQNSARAKQWLAEFVSRTDWVEQEKEQQREEPRHVRTTIYLTPLTAQNLVVFRLDFQQMADFAGAEYTLRYYVHYVRAHPNYNTFLGDKIKRSHKEPNFVYVFVGDSWVRPDERGGIWVLHKGTYYPWNAHGARVKSARKR